MCRAVSPPAPLRASGLDTTSLGTAAPAAYEIGSPINREDDAGPPRRVMMIVHGGGWFLVGRRALQTERRRAAAWQAAGWWTVNVTYRGCAKSIGDVVTFFDLVRARVGPGVPICLEGVSAGGQLAQAVAARRDAACVISIAGPSDLPAIAAQGKRQAKRGESSRLDKGAERLKNLATAAFGSNAGVRQASPIQQAASIRARLLLATAADDWLVPLAQDRNLGTAVRRARPDAYVDVLVLAPGSRRFGHGSASDAALADFGARLARLVASFGR